MHTLDGRVIQAGFQPSGGQSSFSVTFPQAFSGTPVVISIADETGDNSGATVCRLVNVSSAGFSVSCYASGSPTAPDGLQWVALMPTGGQPIRWAGHTLQAGIATPGGSAYGAVTYPVTFSARPSAILASIYELNNNGPTSIRIDARTPPSTTTFRYLTYCCGCGGALIPEQVAWVAVD